MTTLDMKTFEYKGRRSNGKVVSGKLTAQNQSQVLSQLGSMGLSPVDIQERETATGLRKELKLPGFGEKISAKDLALFSRQMATMISAGVPLLRTISILAEQEKNKTLSTALTGVKNDVEQGLALSDSVAKHQKVFPPIMIHLIRAGETGGFLDAALQNVASNLEADMKLRATIKSATTYPIVVLSMAGIAVVAMLVFIVPIFQKMFQDLGSELPAPTQVLVVMSGIMTWFGPLLIVGIFFFSLWWRSNKNTIEVRRVVDPIKMKLPVFGPLLAKVAITRFTRNFAMMLGAGVPLLGALKIVGETSGNTVIEAATHRMSDTVKNGKSITEAISKEEIFPPMLAQMVSVGEDAGALEVMLEKISDFYDSEVQATTAQLTALIEPLMIAVMGIVIGGMIVALYMPIFSIFDSIKK